MTPNVQSSPHRWHAQVLVVVFEIGRRVGVHVVVVVVQSGDVVEPKNALSDERLHHTVNGAENPPVPIRPNVTIQEFVPNVEAPKKISLFDEVGSLGHEPGNLFGFRLGAHGLVVNHGRVGLEHVDRVDPPIAHRDSRERELGFRNDELMFHIGRRRTSGGQAFVLVVNVGGNCGDVVPCNGNTGWSADPS